MTHLGNTSPIRRSRFPRTRRGPYRAAVARQRALREARLSHPRNTFRPVNRALLLPR